MTKTRVLLFSGVLLLALVLLVALIFSFSLTQSSIEQTAFANDYPLRTQVKVYTFYKGQSQLSSFDQVPILDGHTIDEIMAYDHTNGTLTISSWPKWAQDSILNIGINGDDAKDFTVIFECDITGHTLAISGDTSDGSRLFVSSDVPHRVELSSIECDDGDIFVEGKLDLSIKNKQGKGDYVNVYYKAGDNFYIQDNASFSITAIPVYQDSTKLWNFFWGTHFYINTTGKVEVGLKENGWLLSSFMFENCTVEMTKCDGGFYLYYPEDKKHFVRPESNFGEKLAAEDFTGFTNGIRNDGYYYTLYIEPIVVKTQKTVSFNANTGTGDMSDEQTDIDGNYTLPLCTFEKSSYKFAGWAIGSADATPVLSAGTEITLDSNTTIYATWTETDKAQVYYSDGQDSSQNFIEGYYSIGETVTILDNPFTAPEGKVFYRWIVMGYEDKIDNTHYTVADDGEGNGEDITVTAVWTDDPDVWTITYTPGEGTGDTIIKYVEKGEDYKLILNTFTAPSGKEFAGWSVGGQTVPALTTLEDVSSNMDITADWHTLETEMTVNYPEDIIVGDKLEVGLVEAFFNYDDGGTELANPYELNYYYYFPDGIITEIDFNPDTETFSKGRFLILVRWKEDATKFGEMVVYAGCTISFDANSGTGDMDDGFWWRDDEYTLPANGFTAPAHKQFKGWSLTSNGNIIATPTIAVTENITLYAIWEDIPTISFNSNGGSGNMADVEFSGSYTLPANGFTAPANKQFKGWSLTSNGNIIATATIDVNEDTTLYAIWEDIPAVTYTITFNANNGTGTMNPVQYAGTYTLPANGFTAPQGKQFKGWALTADGEVIATATINVTEATTLYAIWEDIPVDPSSIIEETITEQQASAGYNTTAFADAKAAGKTVKITIGTASISFDSAAVNAIGSTANTTIAMTISDNVAELNIPGAQKVVEITLNGFTAGNATVVVPFTTAVPQGKVAKVYFVYGNSKMDMNATFDGTKATFTVPHFSKYVIVFDDIPAPQPENPDEPAVQPKKGLSGGAIAGIVIAIIVALGAAGFCVYWFVFRKKKGDSPKIEEKKEDNTQEEHVKEEQPEEEKKDEE